MILVDTSVWIDNLRAPNRELQERVEAQEVLCHAMVVGELACGNLPERDRFLEQLEGLPSLKTPSDHDLLALIERHAWMGRGIGYVDANLLGAVLEDGNATLWTTDRKLRQLAEELGIAHVPGSVDG
ncbi:MAG: type II toxin-antitoxin system VapC family toxin [Acidobacteriota bacterium]|nr:type II toxin-antitoxin system VapC family toxin [Acidobacteriota bacterium]